MGVALGCQVAGSAAKYMKEKKGKTVQRLTCLNPFYYKIKQEGELTALLKDAAEFVDVEVSELAGEDSLQQIGHADFFIEKIESCDSKGMFITLIPF